MTAVFVMVAKSLWECVRLYTLDKASLASVIILLSESLYRVKIHGFMSRVLQGKIVQSFRIFMVVGELYLTLTIRKSKISVAVGRTGRPVDDIQSRRHRIAIYSGTLCCYIVKQKRF